MMTTMKRGRRSSHRGQDIIDDAAFGLVGAVAILAVLAAVAVLDNTSGLVFSVISPWT